jgi:hypothetical protein
MKEVSRISEEDSDHALCQRGMLVFPSGVALLSRFLVEEYLPPWQHRSFALPF